ncbi:uncharacterized protein LOC143276595 isoform X2 [Babylonia areolata]|uniref:uncharacterized protein LOC143276595 isoform X2 n=1 Tax=Babylonia areolata TaxID=304850 RepID=UPI003FCEF508
MALWSKRTTGYKLGVALFITGSLWYLIGFVLPFWFVSEMNRRYGYSSHTLSYKFSIGLWSQCVQMDDQPRTCISSSNQWPRRGGGWFKAVQSFESIGLIGLIIGVLYAMVANCCKSSTSRTRTLELLAALSGLCGFTGCMIFVGKTRDNIKMSRATDSSYSWGFGLSLTGCLFILLASAFIFINNRDISTTPATAAPAVTYTGGVQGQTYPPPGQGYPPPGQSYPPSGQGYPPPGQSYPPSGQGYPPPGQSYPPSGQGYHPPGQSYPPPEQGYPPAGQSYPPPEQGYPPAGQSYPHAGQSYPPQPGTGYMTQPVYGYPQGYSGASQYAGPSAPPPRQFSDPPPDYSTCVGSQEKK